MEEQDKEKEIEIEKPPVEIGETVTITKGEYKGEDAKVIAVYTNSIAVELNKMQKDGTLARTVFSHKEYKLKKN
ncbi:DUF2187 family protein [Evansella cellulosilytica]|uniref:KOW domain-containing protein n=1 Tax=Evansella cellulosilytica (strain ATCC 21833 / DSM 2522 / FERM P-1141 / JCM 9156 / N-4) TaxID=649639 RepID=E6U0Z2_EVAC2|nr:DUF2187 family protein [Evansella cellulosilytica]ADU30304.1 hypothetical protein Bcell_2042 [Evansella cellulosilytica DSM 2522]